MSQSVNISIRTDAELKRDAETLFADLGLNMTSAMTMFLRQAVHNQGIPFMVSRKTSHTPNAETLAAMDEAKRIAYDERVKGYTNLDELFRDLNA